MRIYFQIGTNDGDDLFKQKCLNESPDMIVLVEPNLSLRPQIEKNYKEIKGVNLFMNAMYYESGKSIELYIPKNNPKTNKAQNGYSYSDIHYSILPMNDWGAKEEMNKIKAETITFDDICHKLGIKDIDYLQIDTEGFDYEILKMINLKEYNIKKIRFEKWFFESERYKNNFPDTMNKYGKNGYLEIEKKLKEHNYILQDIKDKDGNDIIATKV